MISTTGRIELMSDQQPEETSGKSAPASNATPSRSRRKSPPKQRGKITQTARHIADVLDERKPGPRILIHRIVTGLGVDLALDFLRQTQEIEAAGGMTTEEGVKRTPGGIFFRIIKDQEPIGHSATTSLFWPHPIQAEGEPIPPPKEKRLVPLTWPKRLSVIQQLAEQREKGATSMAAAAILKLIGKTEQIAELDTCTVLSITSTIRPHVPKGVPQPQEAPTIYTVYVGRKLWGFIKDAARDPDDQLIVEGFPQLDTETGTIALFAKSVTSKKRDQARRKSKEQPQAEPPTEE